MITENSSNFDFEKDLDAMLREHTQGRTAALDRERELNMFRSGSAPPTVEGSRTAIRSLLGPVHGEDLLSDEELRAHPDYLSYYYSNDNLNPRMPPPLVSREDWRVAQRFRTASSAIGDRRRKGLGDGEGTGSGNGSSLFSMQPGLPRGMNGIERRELKEKEWGNGGLIGLADAGLGARRRSFTDAAQEDLVRLPPISAHYSRPISRNSYGTSNNLNGHLDVQFGQFNNGMNAVGGLRSGAASPGLVRVQSLGSTMSQSFSSAVGSSLSRSTTPVGERLIDAEKKMVSNGFGDAASDVADCGHIAAALSGLNLSNNVRAGGENQVQGHLHHEYVDNPEGLYNMHNDHNNFLPQKIIVKPESDSVHSLAHDGFSKNTGLLQDLGLSALVSNGQISLRDQSTHLSKKIPVIGSNSLAGSSGNYLTDRSNSDFVGRNSFQALPTMLDGQFDEGAGLGSGLWSGSEGQYLSRTGNRVGSAFQAQFMDPLYAQYLQRADYTADLNDPSLGRSYLSANHLDISEYNKAYLIALLAQQRLPHDGSYFGKSGGLNNGFYGNSGVGLHMPYPTLFPGNSLRQNDQVSRLPSGLRSGTSGSKGSWNHLNGTMEQGFASTLLEEFKTDKTRSFELSEIADHVVEFSGDQYGSRFIQQKLETATTEEKNILFPEILSHALVLMTDVFGNYVIQKFFEHGTESHRNQLASQLMGHVLPLSLQMYGCRVIQKALEVVDVEQQTQMVTELDGSVIKCVRDQNGNHVIQKCIECVPQERIQFIISSFYGQVVALSTHPYGCRVIQRVLEHCDDEKTQSIMMDEIMRSVCPLAQDQYGNYVIQHVMQHGKPEERSAIISNLSGQIVKMSQQKFASNVVEKCLTYGTPVERQLLIDEMLGSTDENEPLQAMMKDQFGNYVVQKVLETCDDRNRELILSRIKVHLNALKRYTYGKHIVARVEKLITAGERCIGTSAHRA